MEAWEKVGQELMGRWREARARGGRRLPPPPPFQLAVSQYICGDQTALTEYLCTHQLSLAEQADLAFALDLIASSKAGRPKSLKQMNLDSFAELALFFFRTWRELNEERGVKDWGHREQMKLRSCEFLVELHGLDFDAGALMEQIERPVSRRK